MHRFFVDDAGFQGATAFLEESDTRHAMRVLRLVPGEEVALMDGSRRFLGEIVSLSEAGVQCRLVRELPSTEAGLQITLFQGLPKAEKMELIVQKLTELGAVEVVPVAMQRCVVRLTGKDSEKKRERWQKIARDLRQLQRCWRCMATWTRKFDKNEGRHCRRLLFTRWAVR